MVGRKYSQRQDLKGKLLSLDTSQQYLGKANTGCMSNMITDRIVSSFLFLHDVLRKVMVC